MITYRPMFLVITKIDLSLWIVRDNKIYCGPFASRQDALSAVALLEAGNACFPKATP